MWSLLNNEEFISESNYNEQNTIIEKYIEQLQYDIHSKKIILKLVKKTQKPKITKYKQINYNKIPIFGETTTKTKILKKIEKSIDPIRFLENELNLLDEFDYSHKEEVIIYFNKITNNYLPTWYKKEQDIHKEENEIHKNEIKICQIKEDLEKSECELQELEKEKYINELTKKVPSSLFLLYFGIFTIPLIIGIFILCFYTSPKTAKRNQDKYNEISNLYDKEKIKHLNKEKNSNIKICSLENEINSCYTKIKKIREKDYKSELIVTTDNDFLNLRNALVFKHNEEIKGVYIIWNKTKNLYYVGQSKDVNKRLFKDHFCNNDVKNIIFAKDWFDNDEFLYKIIPLNTKDELDKVEKENIEIYNSYRNGYNKTGGNK